MVKTLVTDHYIPGLFRNIPAFDVKFLFFPSRSRAKKLREKIHLLQISVSSLRLPALTPEDPRQVFLQFNDIYIYTSAWWSYGGNVPRTVGSDVGFPQSVISTVY